MAMKTLLLMRHAKSDWDATFAHDHERPLSGRGVDAASLMGRLLERAGEVPESVVTSAAVRAEETVRRAAAEGKWTCSIRATDRLYNTRLEVALEEVRLEPDTTNRLMVVGHEPTWSLMLSALVGGGHLPLPTAAVARIDLPAERWEDVELGTGELRWLVVPRMMSKVLG
jgi:phosphohistidine phosphatase